MAKINLDLSRTVPAATAIIKNENYKRVWKKGKIEKVIIQFPPGCNFLVEVSFGINNRTILERIKYDDAVIKEVVNEEVKPGDVVWAEIYNYDSSYDHTISINSIYSY